MVHSGQMDPLHTYFCLCGLPSQQKINELSAIAPTHKRHRLYCLFFPFGPASRSPDGTSQMPEFGCTETHQTLCRPFRPQLTHSHRYLSLRSDAMHSYPAGFEAAGPSLKPRESFGTANSPSVGTCRRAAVDESRVSVGRRGPLNILEASRSRLCPG
jgi:hypothetical protein